MVLNMGYSVMCNNDEYPYLIDTKTHLFHVEYHVRDAVTNLVVHKDNTNNIAPNALEMGMPGYSSG